LRNVIVRIPVTGYSIRGLVPSFLRIHVPMGVDTCDLSRGCVKNLISISLAFITHHDPQEETNKNDNGDQKNQSVIVAHTAMGRDEFLFKFACLCKNGLNISILIPNMSNASILSASILQLLPVLAIDYAIAWYYLTFERDGLGLCLSTSSAICLTIALYCFSSLVLSKSTKNRESNIINDMSFCRPMFGVGLLLALGAMYCFIRSLVSINIYAVYISVPIGCLGLSFLILFEIRSHC